MTSPRVRVARAFVLGSVVAAAAVGAAVPAGAAPADSLGATVQTFRTDFVSGTPFPFGYETVDAETDGTGSIRLDAGLLCNSLAPRCAEFTAPLSVRWVNFATGASGAVRLGDVPVVIASGRGSVGIAIYPAYNAGLPSFGVVDS